MKAIMKRKNIFAAFTVLGFVISLSIITCGTLIPDIPMWMLLPVSIPASVYSAVSWIREHKKLETARLIAENQILHIRTAVISDETCDTEGSESTENIEVFISYFGILLDSKIIKFNQNGILLKTVEIGRDFISLSYGTDKRSQNTRLLNTSLSKRELKNIVERFRDETGIVPVIID